MIIALLQAVALAAASLALFRLWRIADPVDRWLRLVVAAGFLVRAVIGQMLFWISWARLPFATSLQKGDGIWFFATDAFAYLRAARSAAGSGLWAIATYDATAPSVIYIKALGVAVWLLGGVASVALLLNLFCYLGAVAIIIRWSREARCSPRAAAIAIAAISLSPSFILWSLQPLKDAFFQLLFVAFVAACAGWQRAWITPTPSRTRVALAAGVMATVLFGLSGIRWYFAFTVMLATALFLLLTILKRSSRRLIAVAASILLLLALRSALVLGAGPYLPASVASVLNPFKREGVSAEPTSIARDVVAAREGFDRTSASTSIRPGKRLVEARPPAPAAVAAAPQPGRDVPAPAAVAAAPQPGRDVPAPASVAAAPQPGRDVPAPASVAAAPQPGRDVPTPASVAAAPQPGRDVPAPIRPPRNTPDDSSRLTAADERQIRAQLNLLVEAWNRGDVATLMDSYSPAALPEFTAAAKVLAVGRQRQLLEDARAGGTVQITDLSISPLARDLVAISLRWKVERPGSQPQAGLVEAQMMRIPGKGWKMLRLVTPDLLGERKVPFGNPHLTKLVAGGAAIVFPQSVGQWLGLFSVSGGRGMLWFTDLDTLVFDAVFLCALLSIALRFSASLRNPLLWLVLSIAVVIGGGLAYSIANLGTLFRLREMVFVALLLVPLVVTTAAPREDPPGDDALAGNERPHVAAP